MNPPVTSRKLRILLAEDVNVIAMSMAHALERAGYEVRVAHDGEECLRMALDDVPDLLLLDIMMPKLDGIEVLKQLRQDERTRNLAVVVCSAKDFKTERDVAAQLGAAGYFIKSSDPDALVTKVADVFSPPAQTATASDQPGGQVWVPMLKTGRAHFKLWGTRGSTPTLGGRFQRHGGNTSCMSFHIGDDLIVFDAGSGIRDLGIEIMGSKARRIHLFITHTHWDHIQGFPFFIPAYVPGYELVIYGSKGFGKNLEDIFRGQLDRDYFPVQMEDMHGNLQFRLLPDGPVNIGDAQVTWEFAHHPLPTVGYKVKAEGRTLVWMPDDEFLQGYTGTPHELTRDHGLVRQFDKIIEFVSGADVLIHEAQYTAEEYPKKIGWGHSSVPNAAVLMKLAGIRRWIVTHHDPMHDDAFLETKLNLTRQILAEIGHPDIAVTHGYDGMTEYLTR
ncbi:response regulator [Prosthecobacter sp.]|uniref:response regulator n=1 Tax=Prosthecobacter sp. TaxID=1965333 RepID=UPI001D8CA136|nr:response regulator [Prosthecobacter sp.]MCB1278077.1 response regulator [Prosthecobacter sp.]